MVIPQPLKEQLTLVTSALETIGVWFGALTMLLVIWTWYEVVFGNKRKLKKLYKLATKQKGELPVVLVANFLKDNKDMTSDVTRFLNEDSQLSAIPGHHIFSLAANRPNIKVDDMPDVVNEIRDIAMRISHTGTDCVHLFYGGPHIIASIIGKEFANSHRVLLYQQDLNTKKYTNFGPLSHHNA